MVCLLLSASLSAQQKADPLAEVVDLYDQGNYQAAADSSRSYLSQNQGLDREDRVQMLIYLSFSLVALGREAEAEASFGELLALDPALDLNPEFVSPKIIDVFRRAKARAGSARPPNPQPRPLVSRPGPSKPQALWRSLLWPGWGQRYQGNRLKGFVLQTASLGTAAGWAVLELGTRQAHGSYLRSTDPEEIQREYRTYNKWYRARNFSVNLMAAVWLYNIVDVLISE